MKTHYEILGVHPGASVNEIRTAYMALALQLHPDKQPLEQTPAQAQATAERFQLISEAWETLRDEQQRAAYDTLISSSARRGPTHDTVAIDDMDYDQGRLVSGAAGSSKASEPLTATADHQSTSNDGTTHFGFSTVPKDRKETLVGEVFKSVAGKYDVMNDVMSAGVHRLWKDHFINTLAPSQTTKLVDVAGGTGDIAFRFLDYIKRKHGSYGDAHVTVIDINPAMLEVGKRRAATFGFPADLDAYTIAFGIRNCTNIDAVVREAYRVLKPGGRFTCLEFSSVQNPLISGVYDAYSFHMIPLLGEIVAGDRESYKYLVESIRKFPAQLEFARIIQDAGFTIVGQGWEDLTFGVAAIHSGFKL
eukprot:jgi/Hompol1/5746/HPOL_004673-RA